MKIFLMILILFAFSFFFARTSAATLIEHTDSEEKWGRHKTGWTDAWGSDFFQKEGIYRSFVENPFKIPHKEWTGFAVSDDPWERGYNNRWAGEYGFDHHFPRHFSFRDHKDRNGSVVPVPEPSTLLLLGSGLLGLGIMSRKRVPR